MGFCSATCQGPRGSLSNLESHPNSETAELRIKGWGSNQGQPSEKEGQMHKLGYRLAVSHEKYPVKPLTGSTGQT